MLEGKTDKILSDAAVHGSHWVLYYNCDPVQQFWPQVLMLKYDQVQVSADGKTLIYYSPVAWSSFLTYWPLVLSGAWFWFGLNRNIMALPLWVVGIYNVSKQNGVGQMQLALYPQNFEFTGCPKNAPIKQTKMVKHGRLVHIPKWSKRVWNGKILLVLMGPFGPLGTISDKNTKCCLAKVLWSRKSTFVWNSPKGPSMVSRNWKS